MWQDLGGLFQGRAEDQAALEALAKAFQDQNVANEEVERNRAPAEQFQVGIMRFSMLLEASQELQQGFSQSFVKLAGRGSAAAAGGLEIVWIFGLQAIFDHFRRALNGTLR